MEPLKILAVGDVVRTCGVEYLSGGKLRRLRDTLGADLVSVNGENSSHDNGLSPDSARAILEAGADVITGGNHTLRRKDIAPFLDDHENVLRPANYPGDAPGCGYTIADCRGQRALVISLAGTTFMEPLDSPFKTADRILGANVGRYDFAILDIHAEATSEKLCLARYLDGRAAIVFGTHTHVPTADAMVLPGGTGYITDLGMTGSQNGILGVKTENVLHKFLKRTPVYFEPAAGNCAAQGALFTVDPATNLCIRVERMDF